MIVDKEMGKGMGSGILRMIGMSVHAGLITC